MSDFYEKAKPLIERVTLTTEEYLQRISLNDGWIADQVYAQRMRLLTLASELSAKADGAKVRVDNMTGSLNREEFIKHLNRLAGESRETVWTDESDKSDNP